VTGAAPGPAVLDWLAAARVDPSVSALRPDYRALVLLAERLVPGPGDAASEALLAEAELARRVVRAS
jgi:hypothetical protein